MSYTITDTGLSVEQFQKLIDAEAIANDGCTYCECLMTINGTFTTDQKTALVCLVPACKLATAKANKMEEFTKNTKELLNKGFSYNGDVFPLALDNRSNYIGIQVFGAFPYKIQNMDKTTVITVADSTAYNAFTSAGMTRYLYIKDGEADLVTELASKTTVDDVDKVIDTRI